MLTIHVRPRAVAGLAALVLLSGCTSEDYSTSSTAGPVNGTMTATISDYGPWKGQRTVSASLTNGSLVIIGEDVNFKKVTLFLVGVSLGATGVPADIAITPVVADSIGYVEYRERYQVGEIFYNTFTTGHAAVTITELSATRVKGTFSFLVVRPPNSNIVPASRSGTTGTFDIRPTIGNQ